MNLSIEENNVWFSVITDPTGALALRQMNPDYPKPDA
jgi:hypothetical protein